MKAMVRRLTAALLALVLAAVAIPATSALAETWIYEGVGKVSAKGTVVLPYAKGADFFAVASKEFPIKKPTNVKSSNPGIVGAKTAQIGCSNYGLLLKPKGLGTARVSLKHKGKTYTFTVKVVSATNPIKSIKNGTKTIAGSKFRFKNGLWVPKSGSIKLVANKSLKITPASGWKLAYVQYYNSNGTYKKAHGLSKVPATYDPVNIVLKNMKTQGYSIVSLNVR